MTQSAALSYSSRHAVYAPQGQPLPYYARPDLSYLDGIYHTAAPAGLVWQASVDTGFLERLIFGRYLMQTSATVADRVPMIQFIDQYNAVLWQSIGSAAVLAGTLALITFGTQFTSAYNSGTNFVLPIPDTVLQPNSSVRFQATNFQVDDQITQLNYYRVLIPTGPPIDSEQQASISAIPTPLLV